MIINTKNNFKTFTFILTFKSMVELKIGNVWSITQKLAKGAFGEIFIGFNTKTMEPVAIKMEPLTAE